MRDDQADADETIGDAEVAIRRLQQARTHADTEEMARLLAEAEALIWAIKSREQGRLIRLLRAVKAQLGT
jgi:hypothetical protein